jgi:hypothetical protein
MRIGEVFRYSSKKDRKPKEVDGLPNFFFYTDLPGANLVLLESGINPVGKVKERRRTPAILINSSPHKIGSSDTPWQDFFNPAKGQIRYCGDNKSTRTDPIKRKGNKALLEQFEIHNSSDKEIRKDAVPIIFFRKKPVYKDGKKRQKGQVEFNGFGVISHAERVVQYNRSEKSDFVNYVFDFTVLSLAEENERFEWGWINARRDPRKSLEETLKIAPKSWKKWIKGGAKSLNTLRRNVSKLQVLPPEDQKPNSSKEKKVLDGIYSFYSASVSKKKRFEYLASLVAAHFIRKTAPEYKEGWVTQGVGDGGADFIGRLDIGSGFGAAKLIVLGQAKCEKPNNPTGGNHIARTVARLKRGWLGVYVTTSFFSNRVQIEILEDKFPLLLIHGKTLAEEVSEIMHEEGFKNVKDYLSSINAQYETAIRQREPEEILLD